MPFRTLFLGAAVLAATVLPVQAAHAASTCLGEKPHYQGSSKSESVLVHSQRFVVNMSGGNDTVAGDPGMDPKAIICMGSGNDKLKSASEASGRGVPVRKLDGGSGKDYATISACFDGGDIIVRDIERLTIVPCGRD